MSAFHSKPHPPVDAPPPSSVFRSHSGVADLGRLECKFRVDIVGTGSTPVRFLEQYPYIIRMTTVVYEGSWSILFHKTSGIYVLSEIVRHWK